VTLSARPRSGEIGQVKLEEAPPRVLVVDDEPTFAARWRACSTAAT